MITSHDIDKLERVLSQLQRKVSQLRAMPKIDGDIRVRTAEKKSLTGGKMSWVMEVAVDLGGYRGCPKVADSAE